MSDEPSPAGNGHVPKEAESGQHTQSSYDREAGRFTSNASGDDDPDSWRDKAQGDMNPTGETSVSHHTNKDRYGEVVEMDDEPDGMWDA